MTVEQRELLAEVRAQLKEAGALTKEQQRRVMLAFSAKRVAKSTSRPLQYMWNCGARGWRDRPPALEQERYDAVVTWVRDFLEVALPDHEDKARELFALIPWPVRVQEHPLAKTDFGPIPTFETVMELQCVRCGGTGVTGFLSGVRCPDC